MILDTDVLVDVHRGFPAALAWLAGEASAPSVAGIAAMELLEGARDRRELRMVQRFLSQFELVWPSEADMVRAHDSYQPLRLSSGIKLIDCLIAATATGIGEELATFNTKHFRQIPDLVTVQPYGR